MLKITKQTNSIQVVGVGNTTYPYNGTLTFPFNSVVLTLDSSNMAVFRSVANNDVLFSALVDDITIDGAKVTKDDIVNKFIAIANTSSSGGESYTLPIASADTLGGVKVGTGLSIDENGTLSSTGGGTADSVAWENVTNKPNEIVNITTELNAKQDTLVSGTNIKTINGETLIGSGDITIQGGGDSYVLPIASADTLGGIKVGTGLSIAEDGTATAVGKTYTNSPNNSGEIFNNYIRNRATSQFSHAEGHGTSALGYYSHAEGSGTNASGTSSHAEGDYTKAEGEYSHAEGSWTTTRNNSEHAQGQNNKSNTGSTDADKTIHSIGIGTSTSDQKNAVEVMTNGDVYINGIGDYDGTNYSSAKTLQEVVNSSSTGGGSGVGKVDQNSGGTGEIFNDYINNKATGQYSHAEGYGNTADGPYSHAEGASNYSVAYCSHAEGDQTNAGGRMSHAEGKCTITQNDSEHAEGSYNKSNTGTSDDQKTIHSIGIGTSFDNQKNAVEVMTNGDVYIVGVGGYDGTNYSTAKSVQELLTELSSLLPQA